MATQCSAAPAVARAPASDPLPETEERAAVAAAACQGKKELHMGRCIVEWNKKHTYRRSRRSGSDRTIADGRERRTG
jgi:hypothetical protein